MFVPRWVSLPSSHLALDFMLAAVSCATPGGCKDIFLLQSQPQGLESALAEPLPSFMHY